MIQVLNENAGCAFHSVPPDTVPSPALSTQIWDAVISDYEQFVWEQFTGSKPLHLNSPSQTLKCTTYKRMTKKLLFFSSCWCILENVLSSCLSCSTTTKHSTLIEWQCPTRLEASFREDNTENIFSQHYTENATPFLTA